MKHNRFIKNSLMFLKLCTFGLLTGIIGGFIGATFAIVLSFVINLRETSPWLILLLPLGSIATLLLYRKFNVDNHRGTNEIIRNLKNKDRINAIIAPLVFVSTAITQLFGGSAGKEGAALQLGGAGSSAISDALKLKGEQRTIFIMSGMSATFASVFGTPLTAAFFVLEFKSSKKIFSLALIPCFISAMVAKKCASLLNVAEEAIHLNRLITFSISTVWKIFVLAIGLSLLSTVMCFAFEKVQIWIKKFIPNSFIRTFIFALTVVILTACIGDMRYNGSGMNMAINAISGSAKWHDFILKLVFTTITLAAGLKGGEIVPTFCIGATFGCFFGGLLGLDSGLAAALGIIGLFCCATNSFISAIFLGIELFGFSILPYIVIICIILWLLSTNDGLFENRFFKSPILKKLIKH